MSDDFPIFFSDIFRRWRIKFELTIAKRRNALIFQDQGVRSICETIFDDYPQAKYRFDVQATLPTHPITTQYRETDWAFITRLLAEAGLAWRIEQPHVMTH